MEQRYRSVKTVIGLLTERRELAGLEGPMAQAEQSGWCGWVR
jgi:hypothetical protein